MSAVCAQARERRWILVVLFLPLAWPGREASAGSVLVGDLPVRLEVDACTGIDPTRLADLLALELRVLMETEPGAGPPATRASVGCGNGTTLLLRVFDSAEVLASASTLDGRAYPLEGRARAVALVLSEMIVRRRAAAPPSPRPTPPAPAPRTSSFELGLLAGFQRLGRPPETAPAVDAIFGWHVRPWLTFHTGARGTTASFDTTPGRVWAPSLSATFALSLDRVRDRTRFGVGAGVRGGWVWLRGDPATGSASGRRFDGAWWGPCVLATASQRIFGRLLVVLHAEGGYVARPVVGQVRPPAPAAPQDVAIDGPWVRVAAGVAWPL
jgi:hypothetical protein